MKLSACMIVKNEEKMLGKTLPSLNRHAEIILVDTGSGDNTIEVAKKYGAKVYHFPWINDFSAARNESLKHASGDWILWIDADEFMKDEDLKILKAILADSKEKAHSLNLYESEIGRCEKKNGYRRIKVFRNKQGVHFERPINEQLVNKDGKFLSGTEIPVCIYHWGTKLDEQKMKEKRERYVKLYSQALEKDPSDAHLHFLLANKLNELKRSDEALAHYSRAVKNAHDRDLKRQVLEKKAELLLRMRKLSEAARAAEALLEIEPNSIPAYSVIASILMVTGKIDEAIKILTEALKIKIEGRLENVYQTRVMPNFLLGKAYEIKGEKEKAEVYFKRSKL